ncbi:sensor histidine kinase [sulfur-oxidizing endosymbiont of Gigantopelta aegis]|uniref:sensor histidine kinase n=1 Tax=sulfur-oxidizing endosymbiont of Gigantopelta aegis TaxID=2794934 RepID=UPI001FE601E5|nr:sensor histidine kinase [sulfur-oxidizing endosymbiont of Gigantopelta aegis]
MLPISINLAKEAPEQASHVPLIRIGVLAFRGKTEAAQRWSATAEYLKQQIPKYRFEILPLNLTEMSLAIEAKYIHFALTNPGNYVALEDRYGISRIATLQTLRRGQLSTSFGSLIITQANNPDIKTLDDLKNHSFMAVSPNAFGGFQLAWRELADHNIDPFSDFSALQFVGFPQDNIVYAVRDNKIDAGTIRVEILLRLIDEGKVNYNDFRILNSKSKANLISNDAYPLSTRLYPEWPFSRLKETSYKLSTQVALALYSMPQDHPAARSSHTAGWTIPLDYSPVYELMRSLKIGPYEVLRQTSLPAIIKKYALWLLVVALLLGLLVIFNFYVSRTNRKLRKIGAVLRNEITERERSQNMLARYKDTLQDKIYERTNELNQTNLSLRKSQVALQKLADITMTPLLSHDEKLLKLLEAGREYYHLPVAVLSSVETSTENSHSQNNQPLTKKALMCKVSGSIDTQDQPSGPLNIDCINRVVEQMGEPLDIPDLDSFTFNTSPNTSPRSKQSHCMQGGLKNYLAAAILVKGKAHCVLEFGGIQSRAEAYSHWDHNILRLMAQWIGSELERKYAHEEQQRHQIELARISRLTAMGEMAASLAHELNQPLTGSINYSSGCIRMLKEGDFDTDKLLLGLERSVEGATLAADIIRQLREFVQKGESKRTAVILNKAVSNVMELLKPELRRHHIEVKLNLLTTIDTVLVNLIQIEQVILNFIRNSIDAMENINSTQRQLIISTFQENDIVSLSVQDSGEGIEEDKLSSIFDAFYTSKAEGMGMGLSISRSIVESNNGRIMAKNLPQGGSLFAFELPAFFETSLPGNKQ